MKTNSVIKDRLKRLFFAVKRALKENELAKERKRNENLLNESEERFRLLFDKAPLGYQSLDTDGNFIEVNQQWLSTLGYRKEEVIGKWFGDFIAPEYVDAFKKRFLVFKEEGTIHSEFEMLHKNGSRLFIAFEGRIGYDTLGKFKQTHCILKDITKVKNEQNEIVKQKEQLQKIFDHLPVMITYHNNTGQNMLINHEVERVLGWTLEEWRTENILEKCYPDQEILKEAYDHLNTGTGVWRDFRTCTKSGSVIDISWTNVPLTDGISMGIGQDITRRKQEEELLKKSQALLRSSIESQQKTIIFSIDRNYNYLMFNKAHSDAMKYAWNADVKIDMNILDCIPVENERMMAKSNYDRALNGESFTITQKYGNVNPEYYESFFNPILDEKNEIIGCTGLARNISHRLLKEEELRNSYLFSETILKTIPFGMDIVDETGTILFQNEKFKKQFGEEAIGEKCWNLYREDKKQCPGCPLINGIVLNKTDTYECHGVCGDRIYDISHTGMLYQGKKAMLEIFQDITGRKKGELKLKGLTSIIDSSLNEIYVFDVSTLKFIYVNQGALNNLGYSGEEIPALTPVEIKPCFTRETFRDTINPLLTGEKIMLNFETIHRRKDGSTYPVEAYLQISGYEGKKVFVAIILDITKRKQDELELIQTKAEAEENEVKFRNLFEHSPIGMIIMGIDGLMFVNKAFCEILGYSEEELQTKKLTEISHPDDALKTSETIQALIDGKIEQSISEKRYIHKSGRTVWVDKSTYLQRDKNGLPQFLVSAIIDTTARKHYEEELITAKEKAEESDRLKSAFLSNMSHEIRTPMNGIIGFSELLKEPNLTIEEQKDFIQTIQVSGARMLNTINNIIDISKIESGLTTLDIKETNINDKLDFAYKFFIQETKAKGLKFSVKKDLPDKDAIIKTDNEKVYGILTNLIKNAIKFTYDGSIEIGYEKKGEFLEFYVKDTGVGIPIKNHHIIFERFRQGSEFHNRFYEGSGLGLSISRSYLEMLGGKIWVESEEGIGSTFYFTIPYNASTEEKDGEKEKVVVKEQPVPGLKKLKILIVEDDEISYSLLVKYVQSFSSEVIHAINGIQAIEACRNNSDLDLVLMDIRIPIMSGLEATKQIRQFNKDVIIIAQTSYGFSSDREQALDAGCNDYITKPIVKSLLHGLIKKYRGI